jgi:polysaccharide pyruvyl transferase WcaK-like protein
MKSLRILTTVHLANQGGCIFTYSLSRALNENLPGYDVRTLDYLPGNWYLHELARALKPQSRSLTFNLGRFVQSERFHRKYLGLDKPTAFYPRGYQGMVELLTRQSYDVLVVGMVIWDMTELPQIPQFPSIYWLSEKIPSTKIAYAASGHRSKSGLIKKNLPDIQRILSSYALIGVRDQITWEMVLESKVDQYVPVSRVPDPAFLYEHQPTRVDEILREHGIDLDRPVLGVLLYGKPDFSRELCSFYKSKGFQTVALSMYNRYADVNLGHKISPFEWADAFRYLTFCVTDRFHGTIFCLKNNIPFVSIEPYAPASLKNSKIFSLLNDFALPECYLDVLREGFRMGDFLGRSEDLRLAWKQDFSPRIFDKLEETQTRSQEFIERIKSVVP